MQFQCTSRRTIQLQTLQMAQESLPFPAGGFDVEPDDSFRCELGDSDHDVHSAYLDLLTDKLRDAFLCWTADGAQQYVMASAPCLKVSSERKACNLFLNHPGECDWGLEDPEELALMAHMDQVRAFTRDYGFPPSWRGLEGG